ncbi:MAG: DUF4275 family protein [Bacilli bacterium]|nr:DUF4275 family protein [Bacilli bacterium]
MEKKEFIQKWLSAFAPNIPKEFYKENIENQYIWHTFSFDFIEKEKYLIGKKARMAFDEIDKKNAIVFRLWDEQNTTHPMQIQFNSSKKLDKLPETYVVASDFSWTYISTHENDWQNLGPYFMKL